MPFTQLETRFVEFDDEILNEDRLIIVSTQFQPVTLTIPGFKDDVSAAGNPFALEIYNVAILHLFGDNELEIKFGDNDKRQIFFADDTARQRSLTRNKLIYLRRKDTQPIAGIDIDAAKVEKHIQFGWEVDEEPILVNDFEAASTDVLQLANSYDIDTRIDFRYVIAGFLNIEPGVNIAVVLNTDDEGSTWRALKLNPDIEPIVERLKQKSDIQTQNDFENRFFKLIVQRVPTHVGFEQIITNLDE